MLKWQANGNFDNCAVFLLFSHLQWKLYGTYRILYMAHLLASVITATIFSLHNVLFSYFRLPKSMCCNWAFVVDYYLWARLQTQFIENTRLRVAFAKNSCNRYRCLLGNKLNGLIGFSVIFATNQTFVTICILLLLPIRVRRFLPIWV